MITSLRPHPQTWEGELPVRPLKVALIREEFVALTGDPLLAIVLNQLLYWTLRVKDFDLLLEEEKIFNPDCNVSSRHGWIYKTADQLTEETMLRVSRSTMRRYLHSLVENGWVDERENPRDKWNKTTQYRLNLRKLQNDLLIIGYSLPGFSLSLEENGAPCQSACLSSKDQIETSRFQNRTPKFQNETSEFQNETSNVKNCSSIYLNRDYSEITNRERSACGRKNLDYGRPSSQKNSSFDPLPLNPAHQSDALPERAFEIWKQIIGPETLHLTESRYERLRHLLHTLFQGDLSQWESFCTRVHSSSFLMGEGVNKWKVAFDWVLLEKNALKILEGNYDDEQGKAQQNQLFQQESRTKQVKEILDSIEDLQWKEWCTQLSQRLLSSEDSLRETYANSFLSVNDLQAISQARFVEFDGRLAWIESSDSKALTYIEDFRFLLLPIIQKTYPSVRNIRTRKEEREHAQETITPILPHLSSSSKVPHLQNEDQEKNASFFSLEEKSLFKASQAPHQEAGKGFPQPSTLPSSHFSNLTPGDQSHDQNPL
jgi:hypothetical protein